VSTGLRGGRPMRRAVFRCDASAVIGGGHVIRCLAIAGALRTQGWWCGFAVAPETVSLVSRLEQEANSILLLSPRGGEDLREAVVIGEWACGHADLLVVDHYRRDVRFERTCRLWAERILVIDDLADRLHDADLLIDPSCGRKIADYADLVPITCGVLAGPGHALVHPAFTAARPKALLRREQLDPPRRILVCFGASDPANATLGALEAIGDTGLALEVDVIIGGRAPHAAAVRRAAAGMPQPTRLHDEATPEEVAQLMTEADLAIGAGGGMALERCCLGLPSIIIEIADNQRHIAVALAGRGAARNLGPAAALQRNALAEALHEMAVNTVDRRAMASAAADICDGHGLRHLLDLLSEPARRAA
jgi:UDP-2,4-diacetamido-2,4,6-trideoxy-beta-L-altropyranose hydrolase